MLLTFTSDIKVQNAANYSIDKNGWVKASLLLFKDSTMVELCTSSVDLILLMTKHMKRYTAWQVTGSVQQYSEEEQHMVVELESASQIWPTRMKSRINKSSGASVTASKPLKAVAKASATLKTIYELLCLLVELPESQMSVASPIRWQKCHLLLEAIQAQLMKDRLMQRNTSKTAEELAGWVLHYLKNTKRKRSSQMMRPKSRLGKSAKKVKVATWQEDKGSEMMEIEGGTAMSDDSWEPGTDDMSSDSHSDN